MDRREEQPGAAGAGAAPALDFTVENVEKVCGPRGGHSGDRAEVLGSGAKARAQAWAGCPLGWCPQDTWHRPSPGRQDSSVPVSSGAVCGFPQTRGLCRDVLGGL